MSNWYGSRDDREVGKDLRPVPHSMQPGKCRALVPGAVQEEDREGKGEEGLGGPALVLDEDVEPEGCCCLPLVLLPRVPQLSDQDVGEGLPKSLGSEPLKRWRPVLGKPAGDQEEVVAEGA